MEEQILIGVKIDAQSAQQELRSVITSVADLKKENAALKKEIEAGKDATGELSAAYAKNAETINDLQARQKALSGELNTTNTTTSDLGDSFYELTRRANALEAQYKSLSKAQRESAAGQEMKKQLTDLKGELKTFDAELGNYQKNVGNYPQILASLVPGFDKVTKVIGNLTGAAGNSVPSLAGMAKGIGGVTKAALKFIATPIGAIIAAIVVAIKLLTSAWNKVTEAIAKNDDAGTAIARLYEVTIQPVIDLVTKAFAKLAGWIGKVANAMAKFFGGSEKSADAAHSIVIATDELEEAERKYTVNSAKRAAKIAKLRDEVTDKEKYTAEQRRQLLQQAIDLETKNLEDEKAIKKERLRIIKETAERDQDTSDETKNKIAQARADMYAAEQAYYSKTKELNSQIIAMGKEEEERKKKEVEDAKKAAAARLEINRALQDAMIAMDTDAVSRQVNILKVAGDREVENLKIKLNNLKKTDKKAREELQKLVVAKEQETQKRIDEVLTGAAEKRAKALRANAYSEMELLTSDALKLAEFRKSQAKQELKSLVEMSAEKRQILYDTEEEYNAAVLEARKKLADESIAVQEEMYNRKQLAEQNEFARELQNIQEGDAVAIAEAELARAQEEQDALVNMNKETKRILYKSEEEYEAAVIAGENRVTAAKKKAVEEQRKMALSNASAIASAMGSLSSLLDQFGEENAAAAKASKAIALGKVAVETGVAIASGVAQAQSVPFPANIAAIATTIATILANIGTAVTTIKSANFNAGGGTIPGTSYTGAAQPLPQFAGGTALVSDGTGRRYSSGDVVPTMLSNDEMVLNPYQYTTIARGLFDFANSPQNYTRVRSDLDYEMLAAAVGSLPAPVMVYSEYKDFKARTADYKELANL